MGRISIGIYKESWGIIQYPSNRPISIAMVNSMSEFDVGLAMAYGTLVLFLTIAGTILLKKWQALVE